MDKTGAEEVTDDKKPDPPMTERDKMLGNYYAEQLRKRIELARVRTPGGLARLFPGLRKK
jgi:hypothetical protein